MLPISRNGATYYIGNSTIRVGYGDLAHSDAEVLVSSDDNYLTMGGGVSAALLRSGGNEIRDHARKLIPLALGDVAVTSAGRLSAKYIFHAVTIDLDRRKYPDHECLKTLTNRALELAENLGIRSISFPALGTGVAGFPFHSAADALIQTICDRLAQNTSVEQVNLLLLAREMVNEDDLATFYERATSLASISGQGQRLATAMARLHDAIGGDALNPATAELLAEIKREVAALSRVPQSVEEIDYLERESHMGSTGRRAVRLTEDLNKSERWKNLDVERKALQTRLEGLSTLLNVHYGSLNKLEIEKAKYAGLGIPLILENQVEEVSMEIRRVEESMIETRKKIQALTGPDS